MKALRKMLVILIGVAALVGVVYFALTSSEVKELVVTDAQGTTQCALFNAAGVLSADNINALQGKEDAIVADGSIWTLPIADPPVYVVNEAEQLHLTPGYCYFSSAAGAQEAINHPVPLDDVSPKPKPVASTSEGSKEPVTEEPDGDAASTSASPSGTDPKAFFAQKVTTPVGFLVVTIVLLIATVVLGLLADKAKRNRTVVDFMIELQSFKMDAASPEPMRRIAGPQGFVAFSATYQLLDPASPSTWVDPLSESRKRTIAQQLQQVIYTLIQADMQDKFMDEILGLFNADFAQKLQTDPKVLDVCRNQLVELVSIAFKPPEINEATRTALNAHAKRLDSLKEIAELKDAGVEPNKQGIFHLGHGVRSAAGALNTLANVRDEAQASRSKSDQD